MVTLLTLLGFTSEEAKQLVATTRVTLAAEAKQQAMQAASESPEGTRQEEATTTNEHISQVTYAAKHIIQNNPGIALTFLMQLFSCAGIHCYRSWLDNDPGKHHHHHVK
jgi:hypothetical protein